MSVLVKAMPASTPRNKTVKKIAVFYAVIIVGMAVAQLFTFDQFLKLFVDFNLPGGTRYAYFLSSFLVTVEVFAVPFLLRMPLSPAFRWVSMVCSWLVAAIWLKLAIGLSMADVTVNNIGFLGTVVDVTPGFGAICISIVLAVLAALVSWGMWPKSKGTSKRKK